MEGRVFTPKDVNDRGHRLRSGSPLQIGVTASDRGHRLGIILALSRLHIQVRIMGNFGFSGGVPWLSHTQGALCFICKENVENVSHFLHDCKEFRQNFDSIWLNLKQKVISANPINESQIFDFISHLDRQQKTLLLLGGLSLPFDQATVTMINRFICSAVSKIYRIRKNRLRELQAPWLKK